MTMTFEPATPTGHKVRCTVCGHVGWGPLDSSQPHLTPWQRKCLLGHPYGCVCGRLFTSRQSLKGHLRFIKEGEAHGPAEDH